MYIRSEKLYKYCIHYWVIIYCIKCKDITGYHKIYIYKDNYVISNNDCVTPMYVCNNMVMLRYSIALKQNNYTQWVLAKVLALGGSYLCIHVTQLTWCICHHGVSDTMKDIEFDLYQDTNIGTLILIYIVVPYFEKNVSQGRYNTHATSTWLSSLCKECLTSLKPWSISALI